MTEFSTKVFNAEHNGDAQAIIESTVALSQVELMSAGFVDGKEVKLASIPEGRSLLSIKALLDEYREFPERKTGTARLNDPASFIGHVNRMKTDDSALFACVDRARPSLTAVYDYHTVEERLPRHCEHRAVYPFPLSDEWTAWTRVDGQFLKQDQFAEFIEDHVMDLANPRAAGERTREYVAAIECELATPAKVAQLSKELDVRVSQKIVQQTRIGSGETQMIFKDEHKDEAGQPLKVPGAFLISIPIFKGGMVAVIPVRLRYRVDVESKSVKWFFNLAMVDELFKAAVDAEISMIQDQVGLPVFVGSPEQ